MDLCELCNMDATYTTSMMRYFQTSFVNGNSFRNFMDVVNLSDGNDLHIMCKGTKYQSGKILNNMKQKILGRPE